eukprot:8528596-Pyramimonas_sp.AAC.1
MAAVRAEQGRIITDGTEPSKGFHTYIPGAADGRARALMLAKHLKLQSGQWRELRIKVVEGSSGTLLHQLDKNPKAARQEAQTKKLMAIGQHWKAGDWRMQHTAG